MAMATLTLEIKIAWWFQIYVKTLMLMQIVTGLEPNPDKVEYWCKKAMTCKVVTV